MTTRTSFVPALGFDFLTPLYDSVAWLIGERALKQRLIERATIAPSADVLDLGCGTGTLALLAKKAQPSARVSGLDIDPKILEIARRKASRGGVDITFCEGSATEPPFPEASFDRILSTLVLHHLDTPTKRTAFSAVRRLLRPGGEFHVADFGRPHTALMQVVSTVVRHVDGHGGTSANLAGELPAMLREAGFSDVSEDERWSTAFGTIAFVRARV